MTTERIVVAPRPKTLDGVMKSWSEEREFFVKRSTMDNRYIEVVRRGTGYVTKINCSIALPSAYYKDFIHWFVVSQRGGSVPTWIVRPSDFKEIVARALTMPAISWTSGAEVFTANMQFETSAGWDLLTDQDFLVTPVLTFEYTTYNTYVNAPTQYVKATSTYSEDSYGAITYVSSDPAIAEVELGTGKVVVKAVGTVTVTATQAASTFNNSATASYTLVSTATAAPVLTFEYASPLTYVVSDGYIANIATSTYSGASYGAITYSSSDASIASVDSSTGVVSILKDGTVTITASQAPSANNTAASNSYQLIVSKETSDIVFATPTPTAQVSSTATYTNIAAASFTGTGYGLIEYSSSDTTIAAVDANSGVVTFIGNGTVTITATQLATTWNTVATETYSLSISGFPVANYLTKNQVDALLSSKLNSNGDTMTGSLVVKGDITVTGVATANSTAKYYPANNTASTVGSTYYTSAEIHSLIAGLVSRSGDTINGNLTVTGNLYASDNITGYNTAANQTPAAEQTKSPQIASPTSTYVYSKSEIDELIAKKVSRSGGTLSGGLSVTGTVTAHGNVTSQGA